MDPTVTDYARWAWMDINEFWKDFASFDKIFFDQWTDFYAIQWWPHVADTEENLRLTTELAGQVAELKSLLLIAAVVIGCLVILFGTLILINQRKTHKLLRELRQAQDKPAPQETSVPEESTSAPSASTDPGPDSPPS